MNLVIAAIRSLRNNLPKLLDCESEFTKRNLLLSLFSGLLTIQTLA
jgi:hypothetical protein